MMLGWDLWELEGGPQTRVLLWALLISMVRSGVNLNLPCGFTLEGGSCRLKGSQDVDSPHLGV